MKTAIAAIAAIAVAFLTASADAQGDPFHVNAALIGAWV